YAAERRALIRDRAWREMPPTGERRGAAAIAGGSGESLDTSYVAVVDAEGNGFSATPSDPNVDAPVVGGVGCVVSGRGSQGWLDPAHKSVVAPGKRPRLTPAPAMLLRDGKLVMPFGTPGGDVQQQAMLQVMLNHVVFDMPLQQAIEAPRVASRSFPDSFWPHAVAPGKLEVERRVAKETRDALTARGHDVSEWPEWEWRAGAVCAVRIADEGARVGAGPLEDPAGARRAQRRAHLVREEDPARQLTHREAAVDVRGQRRRGWHRGDVVEAEERRPQVQRGHVPHVEQEDQREA